MSRAKVFIAIFAALLLCGIAYADGADPKTITPAWVIEQQIAQQQTQTPNEAETQSPPVVQNGTLFFIGYDYPTLSGPLATYLSSWNSLVNFALGIEAPNSVGSSFLTGLELEFFTTVNNQGMRLQMNDMVMLGYSFDLFKVARLNLGARLGLSLLDVTDDQSTNPSYTYLGAIAGPEASIYGMVAKDFWLWARGRYSMSYYFNVGSSGAPDPITAAGANTLNCISLEAGLAFPL